MTEKWYEARLPHELAIAADQRYGQRFASLDELLIFMLTELLRNDVKTLDQAEESLIEERLRELGYV